MMRVLIRCLMTAALVAFLPLTVTAAPITLGTWSPIVPPDRDGRPFWDNVSDDDGEPGCPAAGCNIGAVLLGMGYGPLEFLHTVGDANTAVAFSFAESVLPWTPLFSKTILTAGTPGQLPNGAISYDTIPPGPGETPDPARFVSNSLDDPWQYALFRQVGPNSIRYFIGFEDIERPNGDLDYNDLIMTFTQSRQVAPEPGTMVLLGTALAGIGIRRLRRQS
jgi:hypothetical protein